MSDLTHHQTQDTKAGSSATDSKPQLRLKKKQAKVKEVEATVHLDGSITYQNEAGEEKAYVVDSMEDYRWVMSEAQTLGKKGFEVSHRLFDSLTLAKDTPYIIIGNPAVFVYREGDMKRQQQIDGLDIEDIIELRAKKMRKEAALKAAEKAKMKEEIEL